MLERFDKYLIKILQKLRPGLTPSFAQEGEDMILRRLFEGVHLGFYVDIGAYHPSRFSNTYYFYLRGWTGINIDPQPGVKLLFDKLRPRDINLELAISDKPGVLRYYVYNEPALNGFSAKLACERDAAGIYHVTDEIDIMAYTLGEILDQHISQDQKIEFMNVDTEGWDLQVLNSNNWEKYRPKVVLAEDLDIVSLVSPESSPLVCYMEEKGYNLFAKTLYTLFFRDSR